MKLLPIGSVVKLEDLEPNIMIIGRMVISNNKLNYDYVGVQYPVDYLGDEKVLVNDITHPKLFFAQLENWLRK